MDAFYASVEQRDDPQLRGKPLIVGGTRGRGVVAAASYEVRRYGVRSAMPIRRALALCPEAVCVRPRMARYVAVSGEVFAIFQRYTPLVQGLSLDEAYLDVTHSGLLMGDGVRIAKEIKQAIRDELRLTASVGVAPNKLVAKIASDLDKPDGLTVVTPERIHAVLDPLPVKRLPGLGRKTGEAVAAAGLHTLGELRLADENRLRTLFGKHWLVWRQRAAGIDERAVVPERDDKSVSNERTFDEDLRDPASMHAEVAALADKVAGRLRAKGLRAGCIGIKVRLHDFRTLTRQLTLRTPSCESRVIAAQARMLLDHWLVGVARPRVRLLGVSTRQFVADHQQELFVAPERERNQKLDQTLDAIRKKFGGAALAPASVLKRQR